MASEETAAQRYTYHVDCKHKHKENEVKSLRVLYGCDVFY